MASLLAEPSRPREIGMLEVFACTVQALRAMSDFLISK